MADPAVYAVAVLQDIAFGSDMIAYLQGIDATLEPYGGRFVVHHATPTVKEGELTGRSAVIILAFPDRRSAEEWYDSPAYQEILPLRTANSQAVVALLADGAPEGYTARQGLQGWLAGSRRASPAAGDSTASTER
jgi:uncharacterized protein (DUF1330 family)